MNRFVSLILMATASALVSSPVQGQGPQAFTATAEFEPLDGGGTGRVPVTIVIRHEASEEAVLELRRALSEGGQARLLGAIKGRRDGTLELGPLEHPLNLVASQPTRRGRRIVVVTARRLQVEEINEDRDSLAFPFGVAVFEVDGFGRGSGELYPAAALRVDEHGRVQVDAYQGRPGRLLEVRAR